MQEVSGKRDLLIGGIISFKLPQVFLKSVLFGMMIVFGSVNTTNPNICAVLGR